MCRVGSDEDDFEFAAVEVVANDELVAVSLERRVCLWYQQIWVGFKLEARDVSPDCSFLRLKASTYLEGYDVAFVGPFIHHSPKNFGHLVHLDEQTAFAGLDLMHGLYSTLVNQRVF